MLGELESGCFEGRSGWLASTSGRSVEWRAA